jgi:hypothetical protein
MRAVAIFALLQTSICWAQLPEEYLTLGSEFSGHFWRSLSQAERLSFVLGFQGGYLYSIPDNGPAIEANRKVCLAQFTDPDGKQMGNCIAKSVLTKSDEYVRWEKRNPLPSGRYSDVIEATDRFFAEPENRVMPILAAWSITKWKQEGRPQADIDGLMDRYREGYIRAVRKACEMGWGGLVTASRCQAVGTTLKSPPPK